MTNIVDHFLSTDEFWRRVAPLHIAYEVRRRKLTYLDIKTIASLQSCISTIQELQVPGDFVEFGVALGGSGICLAQGLDEHRRYFGFDVFGMIPPPSEFDGKCVHDRYETIAAGNSIGIDGTKYYGYIDNLLEVVKRNFASMGYAVDDTRINLVKGLFSDTLPSYGSLTIALAHIDCDWYDSVKLSLSYVWPRLSVGGLIILDDYNAWDGCAKATHEFLGSCKGAKLICRAPHAIIRKAA